MRFRSVVCLLGSLVAGAISLAAQDHAAMVMGFDQHRTAHHFLLFSDGGAIDVSVNDPGDTKEP